MELNVRSATLKEKAIFDITHALKTVNNLEPSRERSLVQTKLQEAQMWMEKIND